MSELSDDSNKNSYKHNRLEDQITWYSKKAQHNKIRFRLCQAIILVAGSTIPIINVAGFGDMATRITKSCYINYWNGRTSNKNNSLA